jgi:hypothetical protein
VGKRKKRGKAGLTYFLLNGIGIPSFAGKLDKVVFKASKGSKLINGY